MSKRRFSLRAESNAFLAGILGVVLLTLPVVVGAQFLPLGVGKPQSAGGAGIAFVAAQDAGNTLSGNTAPLSFNYTVGGGANRMLAACMRSDTAGDDDFIAVSYNGTSMLSNVVKHNSAASGIAYIFFLLAPTSGSHTFLAQVATDHFIGGVLADYTGVKQSAQPDASGGGDTVGSGSSVTVTGGLTVVANNSWILTCTTALINQMGACSDGTHDVQRVLDATYQAYSFGDSNAAVAAGAQAVTYHNVVCPSTPSSANMNLISASFSPSP